MCALPLARPVDNSMGEKKRRLAAQPDGQAQADKRILARAIEAHGAGDRVRAGASFETLLANLPADAGTLNAIGVLGLQLGDPARALAPLVRAVGQHLFRRSRAARTYVRSYRLLHRGLSVHRVSLLQPCG